MTDPPILAASLLLMRPAGDADELLIVERAAALRFAGGAFAFPGGRVDHADEVAVRAFADRDDAAARLAALRETAEETGIDLRGDREALASMTLFARWCPEPGATTRRFDTRFYLLRAPRAAEPEADGDEITDAFWIRPQDLLETVAGGRGRLLFPTRRILERLASLRGYDAALAEALALPQTTISGTREQRADGDYLCIPPGLGYPVTEERLGASDRS